MHVCVWQDDQISGRAAICHFGAVVGVALAEAGRQRAKGRGELHALCLCFDYLSNFIY
jgi:hypothetical protein